MKPVVIQVFGDKSKKMEPEHHRIEFPGGSVALDRTSDGKYWVHVAVSTLSELVVETHSGAVKGKIVGSRVDFDVMEYRRRVREGENPIPDMEGVTEEIDHIAICVEPLWPKTELV